MGLDLRSCFPFGFGLLMLLGKPLLLLPSSGNYIIGLHFIRASQHYPSSPLLSSLFPPTVVSPTPLSSVGGMVAFGPHRDANKWRTTRPNRELHNTSNVTFMVKYFKSTFIFLLSLVSTEFSLLQKDTDT